jgi:outer membrane immunogenic protein
MRKLFYANSASLALLATSLTANAADLYVKAKPPAPVPPPFSWTGFYIGGNLGGAWFRNDVTDSFFGLNFNNGNNNGVFLGGGQVGFNYQVSNIVWGVEWDFDGTANNSNNGNTVFVPVLGQTVQVTANDKWVTTFAARLGWAYDRVLFYVKGGGGWVGFNGFTVTNLNTGATFTGSGSSTTDSGWLAGGGLEWAFADYWSLRFEYDFLGLGSRTFTIPAGFPFLAGDTFTRGNRNLQMATVGINYRIGWGTTGAMVAAKY